MTQKRFFYHSFPRRGAASSQEIDKGCQILSAIKDFGLLLTPEFIEWKQPSASGEPRTFPVVQSRVCFTELSPPELPQHAETFGRFALEFEADTVRSLGAIPVFYVPQPTMTQSDGNLLGAALIAIAMDTRAVINRMAVLDTLLNGSTPVAETFKFTAGFVGSPESYKDFSLDRDEAKTVVAAIGHAVTPWNALNSGASALLSFFYPTDNTKHDKALDYYRQREWRIACNFAINGINVLRSLTEPEKERLLEIDRSFFERKVETGLGQKDTLALALIHPGLNGNSPIQMARRVIAPPQAVDRVAKLLASLDNHPAVVSLKDL